LHNFSCHFSRVSNFHVISKKNFLYTNLLSYYTMYIGNMAKKNRYRKSDSDSVVEINTSSEDDRSDDEESFSSSSDDSSSSKKHQLDYNEIK